MQSVKTKAMVETGLLSAIAVIFISFWWYMPILGGFGNMLWPVVPVVLGHKHGIRYAVLSVAIVGFIGAMIFGPLVSAVQVLSFGSLSILIALSYVKNWNYLARYFVPALGFLVGFLIQLAIANYTMGGNLLGSMEMQLGAAQEAMRANYEAMGYAEDQIQQMLAFFNEIVQQMVIMFPGIAYVAGALLAFIVSSFANIIFRRQGIEVPGLRPFTEWQMPMWIAFLFGFSIFGYYWGSTREIELLTTVSMNGLYIAKLLSWVQGLSVVLYFGKRKGFGRGILTAAGVIALFPPLEMIVEVVGLVDMVTQYKLSHIKRAS